MHGGFVVLQERSTEHQILKTLIGITKQIQEPLCANQSQTSFLAGGTLGAFCQQIYVVNR